MKDNCINHPEKEAISFCNSCRRYFCGDCLLEGAKYFYCKEPKCQERYNAEMAESHKKIVYEDMAVIHSPSHETELAMIVSILEGDKIPFFIHNDHFGSLRIGPPIDLFNKKTIMVGKNYEDRAKELLADYFKETKEEQEQQAEYTLWDKLRVIAEFLFFGWYIPGRHREMLPEEKEKT